MRAKIKTPGLRAAALVTCGLASASALGACGDDDFKNDPRPPTAIELTGVVTDSKLIVSPNNVGAGPIVLTVSNQTKDSHTITLEGVGAGQGSSEATKVVETVGPVNPLDTVTIQKTLKPGKYQVKAGSKEAVAPEDRIESAELDIGPAREPGNDDLLLP